MRNRAELILKITCLVLGAALLFHLALTVLHRNPLANVSIPAVPTLASTNAPTETKETNSTLAKAMAKSGTNVPSETASNAAGTNIPMTASAKSNDVVAITNLVSANTNIATNGDTNTMAAVPPESMADTNKIAPPETAKVEGDSKIETNGVALPQPAVADTNQAVASDAISSGTNDTAMMKPLPQGTNLMALTNSGTGTNAIARAGVEKTPGGGSSPNLAMMGMPGLGGKKPPELPPATQARIDRIYESELLGQVMHPMPMALLGIAGSSAFLRTATGQSGLVKEGDLLGNLKLLAIGTNRVLVEEAGEKKELMIFNGYGGESLLTKKETPDETKPK